MDKEGLKQLWQVRRNQSWEQQEKFVNTLIDEIINCRNRSQFFRDDKYAGGSGFKHVEGTVREECDKVLANFSSKFAD